MRSTDATLNAPDHILDRYAPYDLEMILGLASNLRSRSLSSNDSVLNESLALNKSEDGLTWYWRHEIENDLGSHEYKFF